MITSKLSVLITAFEAAPFYKKGGLGDVTGSLPIALHKLGIDVRVVIPYYQIIKKHYPQKKIGEMMLRFGNENRLIRMYEGTFPHTTIPIYFLENQKYFNLTTGKVRRIEEFAFFDLAVCYFTSWLSQHNRWQPQVIHCNDWHTGLIPLILLRKLQSSIPTLLTIHNLLYQGKGSPRILDLLNIQDKDAFEIQRNKPATEINILGEGMLHASMVSTVSETYAKEIMHEHSNNVIYQYLARREKELGKKGDVVGILNGIDEKIWSPARRTPGSFIYTLDDVETGKAKNKKRLLEQYRLKDRPTFAFIGRLANQKGLDVLKKAMEHLVHLDINLILLGEGHYAVEEIVKSMVEKYPDHVRAYIGYSEDLAHELYAGSDFLLMPSHYEPCGLVQMVAMRYGTIPIASATGGLIDTITNSKNGFLFKNGFVQDLIATVRKSLEVYSDKEAFRAMIHHAMRQDFSWDKSAKLYRDLYIDILNYEKTRSKR
jgi:starch synthase